MIEIILRGREGGRFGSVLEMEMEALMRWLENLNRYSVEVGGQEEYEGLEVHENVGYLRRDMKRENTEVEQNEEAKQLFEGDRGK